MKKPKMKTIQTNYTVIRLTSDDIIDLLKFRDLIPNPAEDIVVEFKVPGGGDWSNMNIKITEEDYVRVSFTERFKL